MDPALAIEIEEISKHKIINETIAKGDSDIQGFYENKTIFISGANGYVGRHLCEKILRSCNVRKIYALMRPKKGVAIASRKEQFLSDPVYDLLRNMKPDFADKIVPVAGDICELRLGLSESDRKMLVEEVDIIIHEAATTNFCDPLKKSTLTNVRGTREMLNLGRDCKHLSVFVHVSTAYTPATYSNVNKTVPEIFYPSPVSPQGLIEIADTMEDLRLENMTPALMEDYPNTYAFTKRVAEELVRQHEGQFPIVVVRPGIVTGAYQEPSPGWIEKSAMYSASGFILGMGLGVLHVTNTDPSKNMGYAPVDYVNNGTMAGAYTAAERWKRGEKDIKIYNIVNSRNDLSMRRMKQVIKKYGPAIPTDKVVYSIFHLCVRNKILFYTLYWIFHFIPGFFADMLLRVMGKDPILMKVYKKVFRLNDVVRYYLTNEWDFKDENLIEMYKSLSPADRIIYKCDLGDIPWDRYILIWCIGLRKYIVKDGLKNTQWAQKRLFYLDILHYIITPIYLYGLYKVFTLFLFVVSVLCSYISLFLTSYVVTC